MPWPRLVVTVVTITFAEKNILENPPISLLDGLWSLEVVACGVERNSTRISARTVPRTAMMVSDPR